MLFLSCLPQLPALKHSMELLYDLRQEILPFIVFVGMFVILCLYLFLYLFVNMRWEPNIMKIVGFRDLVTMEHP